MTSAVNVRSQLIRVIFISVIIQCDASTTPGKVLEDEDFHSNYNTLILVSVIAHHRHNNGSGTNNEVIINILKSIK